MTKETVGYYRSNIRTSRDEGSVCAMTYANQQLLIDKLQQENQKYKEVIDKIIELLGNYKHYSIPDEKQNSDNEDLVNKAFDILKGVE